MTRYKVFDPDGKVKEWITSGRGVKVWQNADLSSRDVGGLAFTPADTDGAPNWRYGNTPLDTVTDPDGLFFFERVGLAHGLMVDPDAPAGSLRFKAVVKETLFSETTAGFKAANRAADILADATPDNGREAPIGRVYVAFTVERVTLESTERRSIGNDPAHTRPLVSRSHFAVIEWCAIDRDPTYGQVKP